MASIMDFFTLFAGEASGPFGEMWLYCMALAATFVLLVGMLDIFFQVVKLWK